MEACLIQTLLPLRRIAALSVAITLFAAPIASAQSPGADPPGAAQAQESARSFDELHIRLKPGDTVWVVDAQGREVKGKLRELSSTSLTMDSWGRKTFRAEAVRLVKQKKAHPFGRGALIGGAAGAVIGLALLAGPDGDEAMGTEPLMLGGIGAGVGIGVAALFPRKEFVVYRAPGSSNPVSVSLAPVVAPRARGIALRFVF
jgi:hypothetical protein